MYQFGKYYYKVVHVNTLPLSSLPEQRLAAISADVVGCSIFTEGEDWEDLKAMVKDAVKCHFDDELTPKVIRLHFVREEAIAV